MSDAPTACLLIIGDEILSGRTQDANLKFFGARLAALGIRLKEARVIPDIADVIVETVNTVRALYTYVFTTGGIGPTHDDITTMCVARAFGRNVVKHPEAVRRLVAFYGHMPNEARLRMADVPDGSGVDLIDNRVSAAPGYRIGNVFVMAGVPSIAQAMFDAAVPMLQRGDPVFSNHVEADVKEGDMAAELTDIQSRYPQVSLGSYPSMRGGTYCTSIVARSTDKAAITRALDEVAALMRKLGGAPQMGDLS